MLLASATEETVMATAVDMAEDSVDKEILAMGENLTLEDSDAQVSVVKDYSACFKPLTWNRPVKTKWNMYNGYYILQAMVSEDQVVDFSVGLDILATSLVVLDSLVVSFSKCDLRNWVTSRHERENCENSNNTALNSTHNYFCSF